MKLVRGSKKLVAANEPENLQILVEEKLKQANEVQKGFPAILDALTTAIPQESTISAAEVRYYKGANGVNKIYEEALQTDTMFSYVNLADIKENFPNNTDFFDRAFQKNKNLNIYEIVEDSPESRNIVSRLSRHKQFNFKFLPNDVKISASDILIYSGKVAIINVRSGISGVVFNNLDYYNISKELFNFMWKMLPEM
jgi:hypothetical protein